MEIFLQFYIKETLNRLYIRPCLLPLHMVTQPFMLGEKNHATPNAFAFSHQNVLFYYHPDSQINSLYLDLITAISINFPENYNASNCQFSLKNETYGVESSYLSERVMRKHRKQFPRHFIWLAKLYWHAWIVPGMTDCQYRDEDLALASRGTPPPSVSEVHQPPPSQLGVLLLVRAICTGDN